MIQWIVMTRAQDELGDSRIEPSTDTAKEAADAHA